MWTAKASSRFASLGAYPFAEIDRKVGELKAAGVAVLDFGVGDPTYPTPEFIREATRRALDRHATSGYPSYIGSRAFREAIALWFQRRFGVKLDPDTEVSSSLGSKEAVFNFPEAVLNPGEQVIIPSPGYPPYSTGTLFAEGQALYYPLLESNGFLPDLAALEQQDLSRARILWVNYPNSPTGKVATLAELETIYRWASSRGLLVCSDEAYSELWYDRPAPSMLEVSKQGVLVFQSLSKRSAMTNYRVGFVAGDAGAVALFKRLKTNIDSGTPDFVQDAAVAALGDEAHVDEARAAYRTKRDLLVKTFGELGLHQPAAQGAIYLWQRAPGGLDDVEYAKRLLHPELAIAVVPGSWISKPCGALNPGQGMVRWSLTPALETVQVAVERLKEHANLLKA
jgi:LL-diaminopimelate aminotransferase